MGYRKFKSDLLFTGIDLLDKNAVLITDEEGRIEEITTSETAGEDLEIFDGLLCPGFINTHCHLELSHMKGVIPRGTGLVNFLIRVIKERSFPQEVIREAIVKAAAELFDSGTVAVADICNTAATAFVKISSNMSWHNFIEVTGFTEQPENRFLFASDMLKSFEVNNGKPGDTNGVKYQCSLTPHAPYSVSDQLFRLINQAGSDVITIHNQESEAENELFRNKSGILLDLYKALNIDSAFFQPSGKSSVQSYLPFLDRPSNIILVHNSFSSAEDIHFIKAHTASTAQQVFFASCINANLYIESTTPPLALLKENGCVITLGTDSYASTHSLNLLDEMKTIQSYFPSVALEEMLGWATLNGAKALKLDDVTGSFHRGKKPGIVHISGIENKKLGRDSASSRVL